MTVYYETNKSTGPPHKVLTWHLYNLHRPEIADWIESCRFFANGTTLLVEAKGTNATGIEALSKTRWLETLLFQVAFQAGLPFESIEMATISQSSCYNDALPQEPCGQLRRFTLQVRLRGELGIACEVDCAGLEDALRFGQSQFCFFTERNPWIGLDGLQRKIWILFDPETESL